MAEIVCKRRDASMIYDFFQQFLQGITHPRLSGILALVDIVIGQSFPLCNFFVQQTIFFCRNETFSFGPVWSAVNGLIRYSTDKMKPRLYHKIEPSTEKEQPTLLSVVIPITGFVCGLMLRDKFQNACENFAKSVFNSMSKVRTV